MQGNFIGSREHKELFCHAFLDTHDPYDPEKVVWPELDEQSLARLRAMPFWDEAISTENDVARKVDALAPLEADALVREAIQLQGFEEGRHAALLRKLAARYEIRLPEPKQEPLGPDAEWNFVRVGYGECFDSFFAFGLYVMARDSGLFPAPLLKVVEPIVQEEARHILFFVNWIAWRRANQPLWKRPLDYLRCAAAMTAQIWIRIQSARGANGQSEDDFMLNVKDSLDLPSSPGEFFALCQRQHAERMAPYDPRLLRPRFVPAAIGLVAKVIR